MNYVIIGASAAGLTSAETIREIDGSSKITVVSDEAEQLYSRCLLTYLISGKIKEDGLKFKEADFFKKNNIDIITANGAESIDPKKKEVLLKDKKRIKFDKLLIATGASPKKLGIPGEDLKGVFGLRTIKDAEGIISMLDNVKNVAISGGGLIGLRDAYALKARGKKVTVIVKSPQVLSQMLDKEGADILEKKLTANGIQIKKGVAALEITGKNKVEGIVLDNKEKLPCELVIVGKGVVPNTALLEGTNIKVDKGIIVDDNLRTTHTDIYAAGDVAATQDIAKGNLALNAIWPVAVEQGKVAGLNMAGKKTQYDGSLGMNSVDFFDWPAISIGITKPKEKGFEELKAVDAGNSVYKKIILKDDIIKGMVFIGKVDNAGVIGILIKKKVNVSDVKHLLLKDGFDYAKILPLMEGEEYQYI